VSTVIVARRRKGGWSVKLISGVLGKQAIITLSALEAAERGN
jgi:hypothetical protein